MSKQGGASIVIRVTFLVLMGLIALFFGLLFIAIFVPVVGWYVWTLQDKTNQLEKKVAEMEKKPEP